jgi:hypothetical protein
MIRGEPSRVIGTITVAGRRFELHVLATGLTALTQCLTHHNGVILTAPGQVPLVVLRLGDLLRDSFVHGVQQGGSKTSQRVSASVDPEQPGIGTTPYATERQQQPGWYSAAKRDDR